MGYDDSNWLRKGNSLYRRGRFYKAIDYYNLGLSVQFKGEKSMY